MSPRIGALDVASVPHIPNLTTLAGPSWDLPDGQFLQINWEVDDAGALQLTPPSLHPSIPPFASFFGSTFADSPVGPFSLVQVRLVVRAGVRPRALCLGAVCDSADAVQALRDHWGYPVQLGEVTLARRHDQVRYTAALEGRTVLELAVHTADVIQGSDLMTFDNLNLVRIGDDTGAKLVQVDPEYTIQQADRGRPTVSLPDPQALGMRGALRLASPIIGFTFRADTDLVPVRFTIDTERPAISSTKRVA
ncbi:MAG: acetoacetate decarboxylase family protein [Ilumatobacteraceae bacterium]